MPKRVFSRTRSPRKRTSEFSTVSDGGMFESRPFVMQSKVGGEREKSGLKTSLMRAENYGHHLSQLKSIDVSDPTTVQPKMGMEQPLQLQRTEVLPMQLMYSERPKREKKPPERFGTVNTLEAISGDEYDADSEEDDDPTYSENTNNRQKSNPKAEVSESSYKEEDGKKTHTFKTVGGVEGTVTRNGNITTGKVQNMRYEEGAGRAPTKAARGKVVLHSEKKGKKGRRKHNPNDTHSVHTTGASFLGVPATSKTQTSHDASQNYNKKYFSTEENIRKHGKEPQWEANSRIEEESLTDEERVSAIANQPGMKASQDRIKRRAEAYKAKNPEAKAIKEAECKYTSDQNHQYSTGKLGRDLDKGVKDKWSKDNYDPNNSSGDEDIEKGYVPGEKNREAPSSGGGPAPINAPSPTPQSNQTNIPPSSGGGPGQINVSSPTPRATTPPGNQTPRARPQGNPASPVTTTPPGNPASTPLRRKASVANLRQPGNPASPVTTTPPGNPASTPPLRRKAGVANLRHRNFYH